MRGYDGAWSGEPRDLCESSDLWIFSKSDLKRTVVAEKETQLDILWYGRRYLSAVAGKAALATPGSASAQETLAERMMRANPLLEAFGDAPATRGRFSLNFERVVFETRVWALDDQEFKRVARSRGSSQRSSIRPDRTGNDRDTVVKIDCRSLKKQATRKPPATTTRVASGNSRASRALQRPFWASPKECLGVVSRERLCVSDI